MDKDRGFNFKLLLPPRVNSGQVSAVRPQEVGDDCGGLKHTMQQGYHAFFDMPSVPVSSTSMVMPATPARQDLPKMKVIPQLEREEGNQGDIYSKLFDEVEKIQYWKVKLESELAQKDRRLQESKGTIEKQHKVIQELQLGNESLSTKLEEQISENEDLRNKIDATSNLCNLLKDTFQHTVEKMHLFESEREEAHHLYMENSETIQRKIAAFENLRTEVESERHKVQKVEEGLLQFEGLKEKFEQEYNMKQEEVILLQTKIRDKENELQKNLIALNETQETCKDLEESTNKHYALIQCLKKEQSSLLEKLQCKEQLWREAEKNQEAIADQLAKSTEENALIILKKDSSIEELNKVKDQQADKLVEIQASVKELQNSLTSEMQRASELKLEVTSVNAELEKKVTLVGEITGQSAKKDAQIKILKDELDMKTKSVESLMGKIEVMEFRVEELTADLSRKSEEALLFKNNTEQVSAEKNLLEKNLEVAENTIEDFKGEAKMAEIKVKEIACQLSVELERKRESDLHMEHLKKDIEQKEVKYQELLSSFSQLQSERNSVLDQIVKGSSNVKALEEDMKASKEERVMITKEIQKLEEENQHLREQVHSLNTRIQEQCQETEMLQKNNAGNCEHLQEEMKKKEKKMKAVEAKLCSLKTKLDTKSKAQDECLKENKMLKKQMAKEVEQSSKLEEEINSLKEESDHLKKQAEEDHRLLSEKLTAKSSFATELQNEVKKLKRATAEAVKNTEDTELKCQHKIADMVVLMEKHKSQYDRMVEEKDAELNETKRKEKEALGSRTSLEAELSQNKIENERLRKELSKEMTKRENIQKELNNLKEDFSAINTNQKAVAGSMKSSQTNSKEVICSESPKERSAKRHLLDQTNTRTQNSNTPVRMSTPKMNENHNETPKTSSWSTKRRMGATPKIKSYRIRTPPSTEKSLPWKKMTMELDPKSDCFEQDDLLTFEWAPEPSIPTKQSTLDIYKSVQSTPFHKSPGSSLKLAAMKRMRDAGWTAVTGSTKKRKCFAEKIFV